MHVSPQISSRTEAVVDGDHDLARTGIEEKIRHSLALLRAAWDSAVDGILVANAVGGIVSHNRKFEEIWRIPAEVLASKDRNEILLFILDQLKDPESFVADIRESCRQPDLESRDTLQCKDGRVLNCYSEPERFNGKIIGRVWTFHDATQERMAEAQSHESQKLNAIGHLVGGLAHHFNNILGVVLGYSDLALLDLPRISPARAKVEAIRGAAQRAARITRQLVAFSRQQVLSLRVINVNDHLLRMRDELQQRIGEAIKLKIILDKQPLLISSDTHHLDEVIINLSLNAREAMEHGGELTIETAAVNVNVRRVSIHDKIPPGQYVVLEVQDTGVGMSPAVMGRLFEPFFTTKGVAKRTGLGLATVYGIVKQSGGHIEVQSQPGKGAIFRIYFSRVTEPDAQDSPPSMKSDVNH